jgi:hypothetical protein
MVQVVRQHLRPDLHYFIGHIVQAYSYGPLFFIMSFMAPIAYVVIWFILREVSALAPKEMYQI